MGRKKTCKGASANGRNNTTSGVLPYEVSPKKEGLHDLGALENLRGRKVTGLALR
jgi:hypothetical protein